MIMLIIYIIGVILTPIMILIAEKVLPDAKIGFEFAYDMTEFIFIMIFWPLSLLILYFKIIFYLIHK